MCGIGGIVRFSTDTRPDRAHIPDDWLGILDRAVAPRGPDGRGRWTARARADGHTVDVALVHRRLSIIDEAGGAQPMIATAADGAAAALVFNGCIYNNRSLRAELEAHGHAFLSDHSDTETFLRAWLQWGEDSLARAEAMLACAVWDARDNRLTLARDRFGEKPLYFTRARTPDGDHALAFSSSAAALTELLARWRAGVDDLSISGQTPRHWLRFGFARHPPVSAIEQVPPGSIVGFDGRTLARGRWAPAAWGSRGAPGAGPDRRSAEPSPERIDDLISRAVARRLEADVPLGCFLSGGLDSSMIALHAVRAAGALRTFCVRMPDPRYDESEWAARVAAHIGADHTTLDCEPDPAADMVRLIEWLGLPFGDSSLLPACWVSRAARRQVKVALSGDGGDELFGGYDRHAAARFLPPLSRIATLARTGLLKPRADNKSLSDRLSRLLRAARARDYRELVAVFNARDTDRLVQGTSTDMRADPVTTADGALRWDRDNYLPDDLLRKTDTASMFVGLEVRCPMLDTELWNAVAPLPARRLLPFAKRKALLKAAASRHLPPDIVDRPKQGFAVPVGRWFRTDYGNMRALLEDRLRAPEPFGPPELGVRIDTGAVRRMIDDHLAERAEHGQRLYALLALSIWAGWLTRTIDAARQGKVDR